MNKMYMGSIIFLTLMFSVGCNNNLIDGDTHVKDRQFYNRNLESIILPVLVLMKQLFLLKLERMFLKKRQKLVMII